MPEQDLLSSTADEASKSSSVRGSLNKQANILKDLRSWRRYRGIIKVQQDIDNFAKKLAVEEQPYKRVHDLTETARRETDSSAISSFDFASAELQPQEYLQAFSRGKSTTAYTDNF